MARLNERVVIVGLFILVTLCETAFVSGLRCYECTPSDGRQCMDGLIGKFFKPTECNSSLFTQENTRNESFICISTTERSSNETIYTRRCGLKSESIICNSLNQVNSIGYNLTSCSTCQEDFCNASINIQSNLFLLIFLLISCIYLIKFTS